MHMTVRNLKARKNDRNSLAFEQRLKRSTDALARCHQ